MKRIRTIPLLCILILCLLLTSCSYKDFEDKLMGRKQTINNYESSEFDQYGGIDWRNVEYLGGDPYIRNGEIVFQVIDVSKIELKKMNEPINITNNYINYTVTVHKKQTFTNLESANISLSDMNDYYSDRVTDTTSLPKDWALVVVDITIKNTSQIIDENDFNVSIFRITEKRLINAHTSGEIAYFSEHGINETDYYHWVLEPGEEKTARIGWFIDSKVFNTEHTILEVENITPIFVAFDVR